VSAAPKRKDLSFLSCQFAKTFSKLGVVKQIWIGRRMLLPDVSSPLSDLQIAGLTTGKKKGH